MTSQHSTVFAMSKPVMTPAIAILACRLQLHTVRSRLSASMSRLNCLTEEVTVLLLLSSPGRGSEGGGPEGGGLEGGPRPDEDAEAPAVGG